MHSFSFYVTSTQGAVLLPPHFSAFQVRNKATKTKDTCHHQAHRGQRLKPRLHATFTGRNPVIYSHQSLVWKPSKVCRAVAPGGGAGGRDRQTDPTLSTVQGRTQIAQVVCSGVGVRGAVVLTWYSDSDCRQKDQQGCYS